MQIDVKFRTKDLNNWKKERKRAVIQFIQFFRWAIAPSEEKTVKAQSLIFFKMFFEILTKFFIRLIWSFDGMFKGVTIGRILSAASLTNVGQLWMESLDK